MGKKRDYKEGRKKCGSICRILKFSKAMKIRSTFREKAVKTCKKNRKTKFVLRFTIINYYS